MKISKISIADIAYLLTYQVPVVSENRIIGYESHVTVRCLARSDAIRVNINVVYFCVNKM